MTSESEIQAIRENLFGDKLAYVILFSVTGDEALARIKDLDRRTPKDVMESLLQSPLLAPSEKLTEKPWGMLDHKFALGDYTLVWSRVNQYFKLVETTDPEDPWSNV